MNQIALLALFSLLVPVTAARADSAEPVRRPSFSPPAASYVAYACDATSAQRTVLGEVRAGAAPLSLNEGGLHAKFRLLYLVGQPVLVVNGNFSYDNLAGARHLAEVGPLPAGPDPHYRGAGRGWAGQVFTTRIGWNSKLAWSSRPYPVTVLSFLVPPGFEAGVLREPFPMQVDLRHSVGTRYSADTEWTQLYDATCVAEPLSRAQYEAQRDFAREGVVEAFNGVSEEQVYSLGEAQAFLRERLAELSPDELNAALGIALSSLLAEEAIRRAPALARAVVNAQTAVLRSLAARPATAFLAEALSARTAASLGLRVAGTAAGAGIAVLASAFDLGGSSAQAAEFGGPGYYLTGRGTRALVAAPTAELSRLSHADPLVGPHLVGLARQLGLK